MSSVIVLDSSSEDSSDEVPAKKNFLARSIPATITPIKTSTVPSAAAITNATKLAKARSIPSGITVTRHSPIANCSRSLISNTLLTQTAGNVAKPPLAATLPKINAAFTLNSNERRQTPTPPKLHALPQLQPSPQVRKRKTPTPPQRRLNTPPTVVNAATIAAAAASPTPAATTLMPMISSVHSIAASATPPLQLLATPPHSAGASSFSEQLMINPHLMHSSLPQSTTITPAPQQLTASSASSNNNNNNNNNNINNNGINFKIQLPPKRNSSSTATTPSPAASPVLNKTPPLASPKAQSTLPHAEKTARRIKPTTVLKSNDEEWLQRPRNTPVIPLSDDVVMQMLPASGAATACRTPKVSTLKPDLVVTLSPKPANVNTQAHKTTAQTQRAATAVLDLTESPDKNNAPTSDVILLDETPARPSSVKINGDTVALDTSFETIKDDSQTADEAPATPTSASTKQRENAPLEPDYVELIKVCREADASPDMEKLIQNKLIKYYHGVHPDFVKSRGFRKHIRSVIDSIRTEPNLVYYNLKTIVDELKVRRKSKAVVVNNEEASGTTGNKRTDEQIKKLNKALYILTKRIEALEEAEVDWDDDDSSYLQVERFKKRACQIYEKICDLTGESKNAHRLVKKPIQFAGTAFPQFNKTLQAFINRTKEFPDYYDVLRMLEHCNRQYVLGLVNFEMKRIAHDAFTKVGKLLQSRRKTDLYETVTHFTANAKDPAATDPSLLAKLSENQKHQTKISEIIEKYAREQDLTSEEQKEARVLEKQQSSNAEATADASEDNATKDNATTIVDNEDDDEDDDDDDEDEVNGNDFDADVEKLTNGDTLTDAESDNEMTNNDATMRSVESATACNAAVKTIITTTTTTIASADKENTNNKACDNMQNVHTNLTRKKTVEHNIGVDSDAGAGAADGVVVAHANDIHVDKCDLKTLPNGKVNESIAMTKPSLKIISVSSLNENVKNSSACSSSVTQKQSIDVTPVQVKTIATTNTITTPQSMPQIQQQQQNAVQQTQQQRTVAEIVISDEES